VSALANRLARLEAERTRRRRLRVAEVLAEMEGVSVEEAFAWTEVDPDDKAATAQRFGSGLVDVGELTRFLAERHVLTREETTQAIGQAERCVAQLQERAGEHHGAA